VVQTVWNNLPLEANEPLVPTITMDVSQLLPQRREYYTYMGSLTTPPCSEGVLWIVMKQPITLSPQQIAIFARLYPMNARPVQATAGRLIKESQ
jgi:carbonic anhydrase